MESRVERVAVALTVGVLVLGAGCAGRALCDDPDVICCDATLSEPADYVAPRTKSPARVEFEAVSGVLSVPHKMPKDHRAAPNKKWLALRVPGPGRITIDYEWGDAACPCGIVMTDDLGNKLDSRSNRGRPERLTVSAVRGGAYFVRFKIELLEIRRRVTFKFTAVWEVGPTEDTLEGGASSAP